MKNIKAFSALGFSAVAAALVFSSCELLFNEDKEKATGNLSVLLTDGPFPADLYYAGLGMGWIDE